MSKISLYECLNARYPCYTEEELEKYCEGKNMIYCRKGHELKGATVQKMWRGDPLVFEVCQGCRGLDYMGEWIK